MCFSKKFKKRRRWKKLQPDVQLRLIIRQEFDDVARLTRDLDVETTHRAILDKYKLLETQIYHLPLTQKVQLQSSDPVNRYLWRWRPLIILKEELDIALMIYCHIEPEDFFHIREILASTFEDYD